MQISQWGATCRDLGELRGAAVLALVTRRLYDRVFPLSDRMDAQQESLFFTRLIAPMLKHLKRIAGSTQGDHSVDDLKSEAYLIAMEILEELGGDVQPEDESLQATVVEKVQRLFGRFVNRPMRFAARLDRDEIDEHGDFVGNSIAARLSAPELYEPQVAVERQQIIDERKRAIDARFSQAVAYLRVLDYFDGDKPSIARYLAIPIGALDTRLSRAEMFAQLQPSMFDGIEVLPDDFLPNRGTLRHASRGTRFRRFCVLMRPWQAHLFSRFGAALLRN